MLDKLVKARKLSIREDIVMDAAKALQTHIDQINASLARKARMPTDFAGAIKGKKTISSLRDSADSELARAKVTASKIGDSIRSNLASLTALAADYTFLLNDVQQLVMKANDDLEALINAVAGGRTPISVMTVDWEKLDAMVAAQGNKFSMAGVKLVKVAA